MWMNVKTILVNPKICKCQWMWMSVNVSEYQFDCQWMSIWLSTNVNMNVNVNREIHIHINIHWHWHYPIWGGFLACTCTLTHFMLRHLLFMFIFEQIRKFLFESKDNLL